MCLFISLRDNWQRTLYNHENMNRRVITHDNLLLLCNYWYCYCFRFVIVFVCVFVSVFVLYAIPIRTYRVLFLQCLNFTRKCCVIVVVFDIVIVVVIVFFCYCYCFCFWSNASPMWTCRVLFFLIIATL